jgi:hypothetical protein
MKKYSNSILNILIDKYERSSLYKGDNAVNVKISFKFTKDALPDYYNEYKYELKDEINTQCLYLVETGYINLLWKKYQEGNIIEKIELNLEYLDEIYSSIGRVKKSSMEQDAIEIIEHYKNNETWLGSFALDMVDKLRAKSSIKKYLDIEDTKTIKDVLYALQAILKVRSEIPKRVLSIHLFNDSKRLEAIENKLIRIIVDYGDVDPDVDILAEYNVVSNPGFVYLKGKGIFKCSSGEVDLEALSGEIALGIALINNLEVKQLDVKRILTIENLTSFHTYKPKNELVIYLGGYHNSIRRELLKKIYSYNRTVEFYHWGDIDLGGFRILNHLRKKTEIPFESFLMDVETLKEYIHYGKPIESKSYLDSLKELLNKEEYEEFSETVEFMIENKVKLEQEVIDLR